MDDAQLVQAVCEGDKQAFADIYDRYSGNIFAFLCTVIRNREEAADALQDTFLAAGSRMHQLRDPSKLRPWLFAIARHNAMRGFTAARHDSLEDVDVTDSGPSPEEVAESSELAELLREAAQGLGDQERVVLGLHLEQGLQGQELGDALGVSASHAYVLMNRMRQQVERAMGALLVARQGRKQCDELQALLKPWDGRFSVLWRKRVARHVDGCEVCTEMRKRLVSPIAMAAVPPFIPAPAEARAFVLDNVQLTGAVSDAPGGSFGDSSGGRPWPRRTGGFPPPMVRRRRGGVPVAIVAALVLMLFAGPVSGGFGTQEPELETVPLVFNPDVLASPSAEAGASPKISAAPVPKPGGTAGLPAGGDPNPQGPGSPAAGSGGGDPAGGDPAGGDPAGSGGAGGDPGTTPDPAKEPADATPPKVAVRAQPSAIVAEGCAGRTDPTRAQVTASVSDGSPIDSVVIEYSGTSEKMSGGRGGVYTATIGPFEAAGSIKYIVRATDVEGNVGSATGSVRVACNREPVSPQPPPPGSLQTFDPPQTLFLPPPPPPDPIR